jgi:hypothetical protein
MGTTLGKLHSQAVLIKDLKKYKYVGMTLPD